MKAIELTEDYDWEQDPGMDFVNPLRLVKNLDHFDMMDDVDALLIDHYLDTHGMDKLPSPKHYAGAMDEMQKKFGTVQDVNIADVTFTEKFLDPRKLDAIKAGTSKSASSEFPLIYKYKGAMYAADGNHRLLGAHLKGEKTAKALVLDADELLQ